MKRFEQEVEVKKELQRMKKKLLIIEKRKVRWETNPSEIRNKMFSEQRNPVKSNL